MPASCTKAFAYQQGMLHYFNRVLLEKGIISEREYRAMKLKIQLREKGGGVIVRAGQSKNTSSNADRRKSR